MKYLAAALLVALLLLQYRLWIGTGGFGEVRQLKSEISRQEQENVLLRERNRTLSAEVQDLKKGTVAIEERARTDLGMIGEKETFYQVTPPRSSAAPAREAPAAKPVAPAGSGSPAHAPRSGERSSVLNARGAAVERQ